MKDPTPAEIRLSILQFFAMDSEAQINYATGLLDSSIAPSEPQTELRDLLTATHNMGRRFATNAFGDSFDPAPLEEFEIVAALMLWTNDTSFWTVNDLKGGREWRMLRRLARAAMLHLGYPLVPPCVPYRELMPQVID